MKDNIKVGDWIRHNYSGMNSIEIFKVGKIKDGRCFKEDDSAMSETLDWGYIENCTKMTAQQCVNMDVWNERIHRGLSNDFTADEEKAQKEYNKHQCSDNRYHMVAPDGKQWIDLDKTTPLEVMFDSGYEIEHRLHDGTWIKFSGDVAEILYTLKTHPTDNVYRYRIQEKKPIQITKDMLNDITGNYHNGDLANLEECEKNYGRKIILID